VPPLEVVLPDVFHWNLPDVPVNWITVGDPIFIVNKPPVSNGNEHLLSRASSQTAKFVICPVSE